MALRHGTKTAPGWVVVLEAAETWGMAPWEIDQKTPKLIWWIRYTIYRKELIDGRQA